MGLGLTLTLTPKPNPNQVESRSSCSTRPVGKHASTPSGPAPTAPPTAPPTARGPLSEAQEAPLIAAPCVKGVDPRACIAASSGTEKHAGASRDARRAIRAAVAASPRHPPPPLPPQPTPRLKSYAWVPALLLPVPSPARRERVQRLKASSESHDASNGLGGARAARRRGVSSASLEVGSEGTAGRSSPRELESRRPSLEAVASERPEGAAGKSSPRELESRRPESRLSADFLGLSGSSREAGRSVSVCCSHMGSSLLLMILSEADSGGCMGVGARRLCRARAASGWRALLATLQEAFNGRDRNVTTRAFPRDLRPLQLHPAVAPPR